MLKDNCQLPIKIELPEGFFDEQIRDDYLVSKDTKKIWAVELDLYNELKRVCDKYHLRLLADAGTILGAVRHLGFIPWDDDMDFSMSRSDYRILCEVAHKEFMFPYFWQTEETDPSSCRGHGQLRNSETTALTKQEMEHQYSYNQGIFIDVFPFDHVPDNEKERKAFLRKVSRLIKLRNSYRDIKDGYNNSHGIIYFFKSILINILKDKKYNNYFHRVLEKLKTQFQYQNTRYLANLLLVRKTDYDMLVRPRDWFRDSVSMPFENTTVNVPIGYIEYLTKAYGNWEKPVIGHTVHGEMTYDPVKPYKEFKRTNN